MLAGAAALSALFLATWALSLPLRDASIVDVVWGLAFVLVAWIADALGDGDRGRALVTALLASAWGLRLAAHIGARKLREGEEDRRYHEMRERDPERFPYVALVKVFALQAAVAWIVSLSLFAVAAGTAPVGPLLWAGVALGAVGIAFEAVGDAQLARFKRDPENRGRVMDRGLWRLTRHPNYFGDSVVWIGLFVIALDAGGWWAIASPVVMTALLVRGTGKEMTERHMSKREGYAEYVERTSGFVPLPPRG